MSIKMKDFAIHDFVKWTDQDKDGEFSYTGQIVSMDEKKITFRTNHGTMTIPWEGHGNFEKTKAIKLKDPAPAEDVEVTTTRAPEPVKTTTRKKRDPKTGTKLEKALVIYATLEDKSRQNVIKVFEKELEMTPAGASTYAATCKRQLG